MKENWIKAFDKDRNEVRVRYYKPYTNLFVDENDMFYSAEDLDLCCKIEEDKRSPLDVDLQQWLSDCRKENDEKLQEMTNKMLESLDSKSIADHNAKIAEREYWRKLRGQIFLRICGDYKSVKDAACAVDIAIGKLYKQDKDFFKDE